MKLTKMDWERLRKLRQQFLENTSENYWQEKSDLELYDLIYAQRIAWKWNAMLHHLDALNWKTSSHQLLDWGCGTGIASRTVAAWSGINKVQLFDQSPIAMSIAQEKHSKNEAMCWDQKNFSDTPTLFLISHVISELHDSELQELATLAASAHEVIWVEPGSHELSRKLSSLREIFIDAGHHLIAPCVHQNHCPMLEENHARDWCHFFAKPPIDIFQSAFWHQASRELKIDLRSLPFSYLVFSRLKKISFPTKTDRLIGRPRAFKGYGKLLCCGASGLCERILQKRDNPALFKKLIKNEEDGLVEERAPL